jgi:type III restriction enzyme
MNRAAQSIAQRLSLRVPQARSLEILADVAERFDLSKNADPAAALEAIREAFTTVESFERDFPSLCFALATGVGKTRLMGAFVAYLHIEKGIRHFFVLAPNLTIYDKLIADFTPNTPKYVFQGISQFASAPPLIITGDNYENQRVVRQVDGARGQAQLFEDAVHINIFNISKLNKDSSERKGAPRIKRLSEYIGQSYFEYLSELDDLVLLMDESHRYRGDAGMRVLNELRPVLGLELTATPQIEQSNKTIPFKNIIYSYPLAQALTDELVKEPAVVTRENFSAANYSKEELERLKLEDAVRVHESVKVDLETYARETDTPPSARVKPFILVISENVEHATSLEQIIRDPEFFGGHYADRVITVHSNQKGEEKDETVARLLAVESASEPTEIVIHVNMLKEGWDVTNLYTIVPLRAANSKTLIEQSIGRGLRLPFGHRVKDRPSLNRLNIIAHDRFDELIAEASKPDSIIRATLVIGVDIPEKGQQAVVVPSCIETRLLGTASAAISAGGASTPIPRTKASKSLLATPEEIDLGRLALNSIAGLQKHATEYPTLESLKSEGAKQQLVREVTTKYTSTQATLPGLEAMVSRVVDLVTRTVVEGTIGIPQITLVSSGEITSGYHDFDLDLSNVNYQPVDHVILGKHLRDSSQHYTLGVSLPDAEEARPEDYILRALIDFDDVDYQTQSTLLHKLVSQVVRHLRTNFQGDEDKVLNVVCYFQRQLANLIHAQMDPHFWHHATAYETCVSQGFEHLRAANYVLPAGEGARNFRAEPEQKREIKNMLFGGFTRCLYPYQKFDSNPERKLAVVLEDDGSVQKWCKLARNAAREVFRIHYAKDAQYEPDFVVETATEKLIVEIKRADQMNQDEVQAKARAAVAWCATASSHELENGGKRWRYVLVPDDAVTESATLGALVGQWGK